MCAISWLETESLGRHALNGFEFSLVFFSQNIATLGDALICFRWLLFEYSQLSLVLIRNRKIGRG